MKNISSLILDSDIYLNYLLNNNRLKHQDYSKFIEDMKENEDYQKYENIEHMNIFPYLYTYKIINSYEREEFSRFFKLNMKKLSYIDKVNDDDDIFEIGLKSNENILMLIATFQYFFL